MPDCEFQLTFLFLHFPLFLIEFKIDYINMYQTTFPVECLSEETFPEWFHTCQVTSAITILMKITVRIIIIHQILSLRGVGWVSINLPASNIFQKIFWLQRYCESSEVLLTVSAITILRPLSSKALGCKDFWKPFIPCLVGIHLKALIEYSQMSTHLPGFRSFFSIFHIILYWSS